MKNSRLKTFSIVFCIPVSVCLVLRFAALYFLIDSPMKYYGLCNFELYHDKIIIQQLLGVLSAGMISYAVLRMTGKRILACGAGIFSAIYCPAISYELFYSYDNMLAFYVSAPLALVFFSRRKHFQSWHLFLCGAVLGFTAWLNFSLILFSFMTAVWIIVYVLRMKKPCCKYRLIWMIAGAAPVLLYALPDIAVHADFILQDRVMDISGTPFKAFLNNLVFILRTFEMPAELNYYFICDHVPFMNLLPGPVFLIPAAGAGIMMFLFSRRFYRRESILFISLAAIAVPMAVSGPPQGGVRILLLPLFSIFAVYFFRLLYLSWKDFIRGGKVKMLLVPLITYGLLIHWGYQGDELVRECDFVNYAMALQKAKDKAPEIDMYYRAALVLNPDSENTLRPFGIYLLNSSRPDDAVKLLKHYYDGGGMDYSIISTYALALARTGSIKEAENVMESIRRPYETGFVPYAFEYYSAMALVKAANGKKEEARQACEKALKSTDDQNAKESLEKKMEAF